MRCHIVQFVIVKAFYPLLLYFSIKFSIHFQLRQNTFSW
ncbi:hypothetical protein [Staphylococcus phage PT1-1]